MINPLHLPPAIADPKPHAAYTGEEITRQKIKIRKKILVRNIQRTGRQNNVGGIFYGITKHIDRIGGRTEDQCRRAAR